MFGRLLMAGVFAVLTGAAWAQEARQVLAMTKGNWVAVREFDGKDLLYFSNLLAWRCGVERIRFSVNGGPLEPLKHAPCHVDDAAPNAIYPEDTPPFLSFPLGSVQTITVEVEFPDGSREVGDYERAGVAVR